MKGVFVVLMSFVVFVCVWGLVYKSLTKNWKNKFFCHLLGGAVAFVTWLVLIVIAMPQEHPPQTKDSVSAPSAEETVGSNRKSEARARDASQALVGDLPKEFTGQPSDETKWPSVAAIRIAASDDEKKFLADRTCLDESSCYGPMRFKRYILKRYPDIAHVKFEPDASEAEDEDTLAERRQLFVQSLYFAKQVQLANGQSLFDFLRNCSKRVSWLNAAEETDDSKTHASYFDLRYFPVLRSRQTGREVEMNMLFDRRGNQLIATSPFFSSNALKEPDFLARHELECWPKQ